MKNNKRLLFYQKRFNYLFLNSNIIIICNADNTIICNIKNYLNNNSRLLNNTKIVRIKRKFFTFYYTYIQKYLNSSNLVIIFFNKIVSVDMLTNFLKNINLYYYYIYYNNMCYNLSLNISNLNNSLNIFYSQIQFNFLIILFYLNLYINKK